MYKKHVLLIIIIILSMMQGCKTTESVETHTEDVIIPEDAYSEVENDNMINEVLVTAFTFSEDDLDQMKIDFDAVYEQRRVKVQKYFTEEGFDGITRNRSMSYFGNIFLQYDCTSVIEYIELDYQETSKPDELVCYYKFYMTIIFKDTSLEPFKGLVTGEITLNKSEDEWKINFISMSSTKGYYTSFYKHLDE